MNLEGRISELEKCCHEFKEFMRTNFAFRENFSYPKEYEWVSRVAELATQRLGEGDINYQCGLLPNPELAKKLLYEMKSQFKKSKEVHTAWDRALDPGQVAHRVGLDYVESQSRLPTPPTLPPSTSEVRLPEIGELPLPPRPGGTRKKAKRVRTRRKYINRESHLVI
jgi:hypothetical protein